jgi:hypothetical protein
VSRGISGSGFATRGFDDCAFDSASRLAACGLASASFFADGETDFGFAVVIRGKAYGAREVMAK